MTNIKEWAAEEVRLASEREKKSSEEKNEGDLWEYGVACYNSALKAFNSLADDGHSGMSMTLTKQVLNRLIDNLPLIPVEGKDEEWTEVTSTDEERIFQNKRYSALFKHIKPDGTIVYKDVERGVGYDLDGNAFGSGFVSRIVDEHFPIELPYFPVGQYRVAIYRFDYKSENDTWRVLSIMTPNGQTVRVDQYYKENAKGELIEIDSKEYFKRLEKSMFE